MKKEFGIVGGGITGLAIAQNLIEQGRSVTVFEQSSKLGGLISSCQLGSVRLEKYFHHIFPSDTHIRKLINKLGLEEKLHWMPSRMGFFSQGKTYPFNSPLDLLKFDLLSFTERLKFGINILRTQHRKDAKKLDQLTVKEWVERDWGKPIYDLFWRPLLQGKFGEAADQISAAWLWGRIHARAGGRKKDVERLGYLRGGFPLMLEELEKHLQRKGGDIRKRTPIQHIQHHSENHWTLSSPQESFDFEHVILSIPSPQIVKLCPFLPEKERQSLQNIHYQAILCMVVVMDRPLSSTYWLNIGDRSIPFTGVIEQTNFVPKEDYDNQYVAYLFNYLPQDHAWLKESKEALFSRYEKGLKKVFPHYTPDQIKRIFLFRDAYATPIYTREYLSHTPPIRSSKKGLFFANTSHIFPEDRNMNFSMALADQVTKELHRP